MTTIIPNIPKQTWRRLRGTTAIVRTGLAAGCRALCLLWATVGAVQAETLPSAAGQIPAGLTAADWHTIHSAVEQAT